MSQTREALLARTFVTLADSLVAEYDLIDVLQTLVDNGIELFDATAAGITLGPDAEHLDVIVSTSEQSELIELLQVRSGVGPCIEAYTSGGVVSVSELAEMQKRWPAFARLAEASGYQSVHAIPLRLRGQVLGTFNLFCKREGALEEDNAISAQSLADVATISILQERTLRDSEILRQQLQRALESRVRIEQAKGVLAHTHGLDMDDAYKLLRHHSRSTQTPLNAVVGAVIDGSLKIALTSPKN